MKVVKFVDVGTVISVKFRGGELPYYTIEAPIINIGIREGVSCCFITIACKERFLYIPLDMAAGEFMRIPEEEMKIDVEKARKISSPYDIRDLGEPSYAITMCLARPEKDALFPMATIPKVGDIINIFQNNKFVARTIVKQRWGVNNCYNIGFEGIGLFMFYRNIGQLEKAWHQFGQPKYGNFFIKQEKIVTAEYGSFIIEV